MEAVTLACKKKKKQQKILTNPGYRHPHPVAITTNKIQYVYVYFLRLKEKT